MPARVIDPNFTLNKCGSVAVGGYADGDALTFDFDGVDYVMEPGSHGEITAVRKYNGVGTVTFRLTQGNPVNTLLRALLATRRSFTWLWKDLHGDGIISSPQAIFEKPPKEAWGNSAMAREWTMKVANPKSVGGANALF